MRAALAVIGAVALAGCQSLDWKEGRDPAEPVSDPAAVRLAEAAIRAQEALTRLAAIRGAPPTADIPRRVAPALQRRVTLDWIGPLEAVAARLAADVGYDFVVAGLRPPAPVMVEIDVQDEPVIFVLRDIGLQAGDRALLTADAGRMVVRLDWVTASERGS